MMKTSKFALAMIAALAATAGRAGDSAPFPLDTRTEPIVADSIDIAYDASWIGGDASATAVIRDNGVEVRRTTGAGEFTHTPTGAGRHELTYTTLIGGVAQEEVYRAVVYKGKYTVRFDANGGGGTMADCEVGVDMPFTLPQSTFTKDGHFLLGWALARDGDAVLCDGDSLDELSIAQGETVTLYAVWHEGTGGGSGLSVKYYDISSSGYTTWTQSEAAMTNYFVGRTPTIVTNTLAFGEVLAPGSIESAPVSSRFTQMSELGMAVWEENACRFHGKYANAGTSYFAAFFSGTLFASVSGEYSLAALADDYIVLYIDGERILSGQWDYIYSGSAMLERGIHRISVAYYEQTGGQGFSLQWKKPGDSSYAPIPQSALSDGNMMTYAVRFDANGGEGAMLKRVYASGGDATLPAVEFTREGMYVGGWATTPDGPIEYMPCETIRGGFKVVGGESMTLYAKWLDATPAVGRIYMLTGAPFVGNRLVLRAKPYGNPAGATYTWKRDGVTVATTERLDIASLTDGDFGTYTLSVTTPYGTATSEPYVLEPAQAGVPIGWGADGHGRTTAPEGLTGLAQVASGMNFNLGLSTNGTVTAWGYNGHGGCDVPEGLTGVSSVAAGGYGSQGAAFAVKTDGRVVAWGQPHEVDGYWDYVYGYDPYYGYSSWHDEWREYTNGWDTVSTMPADLADVVQVAVGANFALALKADGHVVSWGKTYQWGWDWNTPLPGRLSDVVAISAGHNSAILLLADGTAVPYGGDYSQWEEEDLRSITPMNAGAISAIKCDDVEAGFAVLDDGSIDGWSYLWGEPEAEYGLAEFPVATGGFAAVDAGQYHAVALDADGNVHVWGALRYGMGTIPPYATNAFAIAAGGYHCTALVPDADGDSICDAEEIAYGRDPLVWEDWRRVAVGGTVATDFGPVAGAVVQFFDANGNLRGRTRTDEDGAYCVANLLPAPYTVKVEADGAVDAWYDGVTAAPGAVPTPYAVPGGSDIDDLDFLLAPGQGPAAGGVTGFEPVGWEEDDLVEVALPNGTVAYLDMWPTEMDNAGTIDIGEVAASHAGAASHAVQPGTWTAPAASHTVTLKLPGTGAAVPSPVGVKGREGARIPVKVVTDGPRGSLAIATEPAGATVYVDYADTPLGVTPLAVGNLLAGSHTILLKKDGYLRPRPVVATVVPEEGPTEVAVPLNTPADTNEMTVAVTCVLPDQEIYLDYLPTGEVAPATVGGMDPASHAGTGWYSASHTILLKHPMVRPWAPRYVPEPAIDAETGEMRYDSAIDIAGPQLYDDSDGDGVRNDIAMASGKNPFYTLEEALDATNLVWCTGGDRLWRALKTEEVPTGGFGRSGAIGNGEATWVETTVKGAGTLSFKWRTSCQRRLDTVRFSVDGTDKERLFGETEWTAISVAVAGVTNHTFRWAFTRGTSGSAGENCAWLDEVVWTPDAAANARTLSVTSRYDTCDPLPGTHTFAWGDEIAASAAAIRSNGLERATCTGWTGTGSVPASGSGTNVTFTIEVDSEIEWLWATEYRLELDVAGQGTLSSESGWFAEGEMAVVTATPGLYQRFVRWEGDTDGCVADGATLTAPMTQGRDIRAVFEQATCELTVANAFGEAWPTNGIHVFDMGTEVSAWSTNIVEEVRTRYLCTGWTGTGSVPAAGDGTNAVFTLLDDSSLAWTWQTNYLVRVTVEGDGTTDIGEAWIEAGSNLVVTATPGGTAYTSATWSGDIEGAIPDGLRITVTVDAPKDISISFEALGIGRALEQESRQWTTGVDGPSWIPLTEGSHDGVDACRSGTISGGYGESVLSSTFNGPGDLTFWWRLGDFTSTCGIDLNVDGQDVNVWLVDAGGWTQETVTLGEGTHTVEWIFWSDGLDPLAAAWLDEIAFSGDGEALSETQTTDVPVPYVWLDSFGLGGHSEAEYEVAANATAANGVNKVWECYVAGINPTNEAAKFEAWIEFDDEGNPVVTWNPKLTPEEEAKRIYTEIGKTNLTDVFWTPITDSNRGGMRFFKVDVEMK